VNRTTLSLIGVAVALAAVFGVATAAAPTPAPPPPAPGTQSVSDTAQRKPIQRSTLTCPGPTGSDYDTTAYVAYTPADNGTSATGGTAQLTPIVQTDGVGDNLAAPKGHPKPFLPLKTPGTPVTGSGDTNSSYPLVGAADGRFAPGWTVQETTTVNAGTGMGLLGTACGPAGTDFWFPGAYADSKDLDYVDLTNPDETTATADITVYDSHGPLKTRAGESITVPGDSSVPVLLSTFVNGTVHGAVTVHVQVRTGRVGAALQALASNGSDWLPPTADPATSAVLPGIPAKASSVHLVGYATGANDADLKVQLLTPTGPITPSGAESIHLRSGVSTTVNLPKLTQGQVGSLLLTPSDPTQAEPFVAALQVAITKNHSTDFAYIPATQPVGPRASAADNHSVGSSHLTLTATTGKATVKIISSATTKGGTSNSTTVSIDPNTAKAITLPAPHGSGTFAVTVETLSGGPVYATRELDETVSGVPGFTIQTLPDDGGYVDVPQAGQDLSILEP
jgi:hypothetical protein